jgi:acetylserotonin N-methyltransferase
MSEAATSLPDPAPVIDLIEAFRRSKAMFAAVSLGVFDRLAEARTDAATLAAQIGLIPTPWGACLTPAPGWACSTRRIKRTPPRLWLRPICAVRVLTP